MMKKLVELIHSKPYYFLLGIIGLAASFRFYEINYQSLWADELHSIISTAPENSIASIIEYCKSDQPPVFFIFMHAVFKLFTYNEITGRVACAVIGLISIVVIYLLGVEIKNKEVGLFASFLTSINFFHIYYSQELRFYTMAFLMASLSYLFFIKAYKKITFSALFLYALSTIGLLYTHYFGLFIFGTQGITFIYLILKERKFQLIPFGVLSAVLICAAFLPWVPTLLSDLKTPAESSWIKPPSAFFVAEYFYDYTGKDAFTTTLFILFIGLFIKEFRSKKTDGIYLILILWIALCYLVPYIKSVFGTPILHNRYTIVVLPAWFLVFSLGWERLASAGLKYTLSGMLVISLLINLAFFKKYYTRITKDQFRECSQFVIERNKEHYPMYAHPPLAWHFNYYFRDQPNKVITLTERKAEGKCWLLQGHFSEEEKEIILNMMSNEFIFLEKHKFIGADAILMQAKESKN